MNICVYGSSRNGKDPELIKLTEQLGEALAKNGHNLVFGGGANGMMGAIARGFKKGGGKVTAIVPGFFNVDGVLYDGIDETIFTFTMRERKKKMEEMSDAFIVTPGGIGTYDEFFEMYTLYTLDQVKKKIVVYNIKGYYDSMISFIDNTIECDFMRKEKKDMIKYFSDSQSLISYIEGE